MTRVEICVETPQGVAAANMAGADRIELCASLDVGGLTPGVGLMRCAARGDIPALAMMRPRAGSFVFDDDEAAVMIDDIGAAREAGLRGVVLGAIRPDGTLDHDLLLRLSDHCAEMERTLHRVFDLVRDPAEELEFAISAGFTRILTSGQRPTAPQGQDCLARLNAQAAGRIIILAGSGVNAGNAGELIRATGVSEVHASCRRPARPSTDEGAFGFGPMPGLTDPDAIRALVAAVRECGPVAS
ncbi:copper homeostasis protein CutC [Novacetimonas maltaceti]|uniref:PF03932 family protein CutC n=1 Tax=Novacetimonas maltaceti TaxID=1203393 RepID=A0A2S3W1Y7_9PROT|nr:copper homeostasis protein CutC [Novacetimonas maltaceti]POF62895.1 Copper homeostasis protein CutC [Novacetimonas maltaceti]PYD59650.1 copper homeostasis protein CutC [Novacetimonas maltaceti]